LLVAVVGPILVVTLTGMEREGGLHTGWTAKGVWWSFVAGGAGALGALGMLLAFNFGGKPHYVPPLIFGLAPVVNTFFTLAVNPGLRDQLRGDLVRGSFFTAGLLLVAVGAVTVLVAAPKATPKPPASTAQAEMAPAKPEPAAAEAPPESQRTQPTDRES
jgi:hypothetical protein